MIDGLAYDESGAGPPVVLVHAGIADRRMWRHQVAELSARHRVIAYDWRGHGDSADPAEELVHHEDLLRLMDGLGVARAVLAGSSMGGSYAIEAALAAPHRVAGLVLISSGLSGHAWPAEMIAQARERVHSTVEADRLAAYRSGTAERIDPADLDAFATAHTLWQVAGPDRGIGDLDPQVWQQAFTMMRRVFERAWSRPPVPERHLAAARRLSEVAVPTMVVNGLADVPAIQAVSDVLTQEIPGARRLDLPATGHLPPLERPDQVNAAIRDFLRELDW
ncbi:alpha/beta fold hydrolase [Nonomuraea sp. NN258]|uniref:alpha/beta fold hydrolase n=1 Tax=Nonomuraea antri TaxID=2730852 RepID=UPI001569AF14|nr:alpha/beta fold hydrolase [Nonomuraea antri]NRQ34073.1 alpha/beta fold hydrolase [Nonomuraea antri]